MNEPKINNLDCTVSAGAVSKEKRYAEEWKKYKAWYNSQPGNRVML